MTGKPATRGLLGARREELLKEDRRLLSELQVLLARLEAAPEDQATLRDSIRQLDELFLLVVAGEFNSGKSALINALIGERLLAEGVTPTTAHLHLLKHVANTGGGSGRDEPFATVSAEAELLRHLNLVDTPGTNAIAREHEALTREFIPRSDLVLFVTSADRPFTESERAFLSAIREWGKKIVLVVNKIDILSSPQEVARVESFVAESALTLLGFAPAIFPLSARRALSAKLALAASAESGEALAELDASRFGALEATIAATLDETGRVRLKLLSPLGVGSRLAGRYLELAGGREELLKEDFQALEDIDRQLEVYRGDMERGFRFRLSDVETVLDEFEGRGHDFFEETVRVGRIFDLVNRARVKSDFERRVVGDLPVVIERKVGEIIDWLVASELEQWEAVRDHVAKRRNRHADRIVGGGGGTFALDRARRLDTVGKAAQKAVEHYDREHEAGRMADSVQRAVAGAALLEVGAIGLGAVLTAVATTTAVDVTGILAAGALAALGLFVLPARRKAAQREFRAKIGEMKERLITTLTAQFEREMAGSVERIRGAVAPYTRFIRAERRRIEETREQLTALGHGLDRLKREIEDLE